MTKEIKLTQGQVALVDDDDYERVNQFKWCAVRHDKTFYASRRQRNTTIYLHRFIMKSSKGIDIDHKDRNGLNCQKNNLRECNDSKNMQNGSLRKDNTSGYKGVSRKDKPSKKNQKHNWRVLIYVDTKQIHVGYFDTSEEAARAYDKAAHSYFGEFACTNF